MINELGEYKMNVEERLKQKSLSKLALQLTNEKISLSTIKLYLSKISKFRIWINETQNLNLQNDDELINYLRTIDTTNLILSYLNYMSNRNLSFHTISDNIYAIHKILKINKVKFDWDTIREDYTPEPKALVSDRIPLKEEIQETFHCYLTSLRDKVMLLLGIHGLRASLIASLRLYEINLEWGKQYGEEGIGLITVHKYDKQNKIYQRRKMGKIKEYYIPITKECVHYINKYLKERKKHGEVITEDSLVLTTSYGDRKGVQLQYDFCSKRFRVLINKLGFNKKTVDKANVKRYELHFHSLRQYFRTMCSNAGCVIGHFEGWLGHKGKHLENSYEKFLGNETKHLEDFLKVEPYITIYSEAPRLTRVETELQRLKKLMEYEDVETKGKPMKLEPKAIVIDIHDVERYAELINLGYRVTRENETKICLEKH